MKANCVILEGSWERSHEIPQVLPYFQALAATHRGLSVTHRTIRCAADVEYWVKKIPKNSRSLLYFACHGQGLDLYLQPKGNDSRVNRAQLIAALENAKTGAIAFLHFGCCEMVGRPRRKSLEPLAQACDAYWVSGYTNTVDWLQSTLIDLALVAELYLAFAREGLRRGPKLQTKAKVFMARYQELARSLGFTGLSHLAPEHYRLFPPRLAPK